MNFIINQFSRQQHLLSEAKIQLGENIKTKQLVSKKCHENSSFSKCQSLLSTKLRNLIIGHDAKLTVSACRCEMAVFCSINLGGWLIIQEITMMFVILQKLSFDKLGPSHKGGGLFIFVQASWSCSCR